ncbi:MAG: class I SAM-dependent methyltransferase [Alphaproteobacteria bacterium]
MNRLDNMIARLTTQRACLSEALELIADIPGPILEIGFGKGRTYDFLRRAAPSREIYAFDHDGAPGTDWGPDEEHFLTGDFRAAFRQVPARIGALAALAHCDIGSEDRERDAELARWLTGALPALMAPAGIVVSDRELTIAGAQPLPLPDEASDFPYFLVRIAAVSFSPRPGA